MNAALASHAPGARLPRPGRSPLGKALVLCALVALAVPVHAKPAKYEIDPEHFTVGFLVHHVSYSKVLGMFRRAAGTYVGDEVELIIEFEARRE